LPREQYKLSAHFVNDFYTTGSVTIPVILLNYYKDLNITEVDLVLLLHLIRKTQVEQDYFPSSEDLAKDMTIDPLAIKSIIASLIEKGLLSIESKFDETSGEWLDSYSMYGLFEKIAELWVFKKTNEEVNEHKEETIIKEVLSQLYKTFEKEFGRLLSPMEVSQIAEWYEGDKYSPELIYEALKRAVLRNVLNFKYIDSILRDWSRNNIKNVKQVEMYDKKFQIKNTSLKTSKTKDKGKSTIDREKDKYKNLYLS
jgi:DNA replication protein